MKKIARPVANKDITTIDDKTLAAATAGCLCAVPSRYVFVRSITRVKPSAAPPPAPAPAPAKAAAPPAPAPAPSSTTIVNSIAMVPAFGISWFRRGLFLAV